MPPYMHFIPSSSLQTSTPKRCTNFFPYNDDDDYPLKIVMWWPDLTTKQHGTHTHKQLMELCGGGSKVVGAIREKTIIASSLSQEQEQSVWPYMHNKKTRMNNIRLSLHSSHTLMPTRAWYAGQCNSPPRKKPDQLLWVCSRQEYGINGNV